MNKELKLPEMLRKLLKDNKMTHNALAIKMNVCLNTVDKWTSGGSNPTIFSLMEMADIFNVSLDYLVYGEGGRWSD